MIPDDPRRGPFGVVACLVDEGADQVRLVFDDVTSSDTSYPQQWRASWFFTRNDYDRDRFLGSDLTDEDFASIGRALVARLAALRKGTTR